MRGNAEIFYTNECSNSRSSIAATPQLNGPDPSTKMLTFHHKSILPCWTRATRAPPRLGGEINPKLRLTASVEARSRRRFVSIQLSD